MGPSTEPSTRPADYQPATTQPRPGQGCDGTVIPIGAGTAASMQQNVTFWSLGINGIIFKASIWRIRNANPVPVTVQLSGGLLSSTKTWTIPARSDVIAYSLAIGWTGEHQLRLYRGGQWVLVDRKTPASTTYRGC